MNIYSIHQIPNMPSLLPGQAVPICKLHHTPCDFFSVSHLCALPLSIKVPTFPCQTLKHFFFLSSSFYAAYSVDLLLLSIHLYNPLPQCHTLFDEPVIRICSLSELLTSTPHSFYNHQLLCFWFTCSITPTTSWRVIKMCDLLNLLISHYVSLFFLFLSA